MKKIYRITLLSVAAAASLLLSGCTKYLGIKPRGYEIAYKLEHFRGLLFGTEPYMMNETFPYMSFELNTDADGYANAYSMMGTATCNAYKWSDDIYREDETCGEWNVHTQMLYTLNVVIKGVMSAEDGTEEEKLAIQSEARMLRAWHTFQMAQYFGKPYNATTAATDLCVPIITTASTTGESYPRKTVQEVYDFVISEMLDAEPHLVDCEEHFLRVFKATGYAMLGRVYWMKGDYESAYSQFKTSVETLDKYKTTGFLDYNTMITDEGSIDSYPIDETQNPELLYDFKMLSNLWAAMYPTYYGSILFGLKTDVLKTYFGNDDCRLAFISGLRSGKSAYASFKASDSYYINISHMTSNIGITVPDLYLMYSECQAILGYTDAAKQTLYELRKNRMPAASATIPSSVDSQDKLVRFAEAERIREFIGYGNLWYDMRRLWNDPLFQDMKSYYTHTDGTTTYTLSEKRLTMRIPPSITVWHSDYINNE